jgi:hypothetical protein
MLRMMIELMTTHTWSMVDLRSLVSCCVLLVACANTSAPQGEGLGTAGESTLQDGGCAHSSVTSSSKHAYSSTSDHRSTIV